jgi:hypothetical protein
MVPRVLLWALLAAVEVALMSCRRAVAMAVWGHSVVQCRRESGSWQSGHGNGGATSGSRFLLTLPPCRCLSHTSRLRNASSGAEAEASLAARAIVDGLESSHIGGLGIAACARMVSRLCR